MRRDAKRTAPSLGFKAKKRSALHLHVESNPFAVSEWHMEEKHVMECEEKRNTDEGNVQERKKKKTKMKKSFVADASFRELQRDDCI